jgi:hypothetical protein
MQTEPSGVKQNPDPKPDDIHISEKRPPRKGGNGIGEAALQAAFTLGLCAVMDDRANVALDHFAERRVVFFGTSFSSFLGWFFCIMESNITVVAIDN